VDIVGYALLAMAAAGLGAMGGLGGAILLVPALVLTGMPTAEAAPLGLISVAAGSIAAGAQQLRERSTNHRLGVATEIAGSAGAVLGATIAGIVSDSLLTYVLAAVAAVAAAASFRSRTVMDLGPGPATEVGERIGSLSGAHPSPSGVVPYTVRHLPIGIGLVAVAGVIAGTAGASGGFIKTPATSEIMGVPARVAASTTTFTVGITSSAALIVMALDGRIDTRVSSVIIAGSLLGGRLGAGLQSRLPDQLLRQILGALLALVALVLAVRA
jgi:uncharacterized membrane protein YfcA